MKKRACNLPGNRSKDAMSEVDTELLIRGMRKPDGEDSCQGSAASSKFTSQATVGSEDNPAPKNESDENQKLEAKMKALNVLRGCASASECFLDARGSLWVRRFQTVQQAIRAGFEVLRQSGKRSQSNGVAASLNMANSLPMHADQFGDTFLRHVGFQPGLAYSLADHSQHLLVCHAPSWKGYAPLLTPRKDSIKNWLANPGHTKMCARIGQQKLKRWRQFRKPFAAES
jgi:hypothetical protein